MWPSFDTIAVNGRCWVDLLGHTGMNWRCQDALRHHHRKQVVLGRSDRLAPALKAGVANALVACPRQGASAYPLSIRCKNARSLQ